MSDERAQKQIDRLGSAKMATDWGARILANDSQLYDPLSYHYGSVWGLFTGWQSVAAYNYGRPHVGYQALMANSLLTYSNALGYVTELLSGDFNAPFGRSSHHQVWSEAMVISPVMRGMLGIEVSNAGKTVKFAPQIPANWNDLNVRNVRAGTSQIDFKLKRGSGKMTININQKSNGSPVRLILSPSFPLDAVVKNVTANGKKVAFQMKSNGDVQQAEVKFEITGAPTEISFDYTEGTEIYVEMPSLTAGAENQGLRIIKSQARKDGLFLSLEGRGGQNYSVGVRSPRIFKGIEGVKIASGSERKLQISFVGETDSYVKREIILPFAAR